jgi:hypothetical protein
MAMGAPPPVARDAVADTELVAPISIKNRAATNFTTYTILTEKYIPDSRSFDTIPTRDGNDNDVLRECAEEDDTIQTTSHETTASSCTKTLSSPTPNNTNDNVQIVSVPPTVLPLAEDNSGFPMLQYFYDTVEIGAETVISAACSTSDDGNKTSMQSSNHIVTVTMDDGVGVNYDSNPNAAILSQPSDLSAISQESSPPVETEDPVIEETTAEGIEVQPDTALCGMKATDFVLQHDKWCGISHAIMWSNKDSIDSTVNIRSEVLNILGPTFADESEGMEIDQRMLVESEMSTPKVDIDTINNEVHDGPDIKSPRVAELLNEIDAIGKSLSMETEDQDQFIKKLTVIKQHLLEINNALSTAPDDAQAEYVRVVLRTAVLNAEVESRRAELELKKIRLESMQVESQISELAVGTSTEVNVLEQVWNKLKWKKLSLKR